MKENQTTSYQLQQSLSHIEEVEKEQYYTQEKINALTTEIDSAKQRLIQDEGEKRQI